MRRFLLTLVLLLTSSVAQAQITRDTQKDLGNNSGAGPTLTVSYTMGSVSNGLLLVGFLGDLQVGVDDCSGGGNGVVWNTSETFTLIAKRATDASINRIAYLFYLLNPSAGTHNIVITCGSTHYILGAAASYAGVGALDQSTTLESTSTTSYTATLASVTANAAVMMITGSTGNGGNPGWAAGAGTTQVVIDAAFNAYAIYESSPVTTSGGSVSLIETTVNPVVRAVVIASFTQAGGGGGGSTTTGCFRTLLGAGPCGD